MSDAAGRTPSPSRHDPRGLAARPAPRFRLLTATGAASRRGGDRRQSARPQRQAARTRTHVARRCVMIRPFTCVCFLLACGSGPVPLSVQASRADARSRDREDRARHRELREQTRVLHAEWTLQNDPQRLQALADQFLNLKTVTPGQFTSMADLDSRLPAVQRARPPAAARLMCRLPRRHAPEEQPEEPQRRIRRRSHRHRAAAPVSAARRTTPPRAAGTQAAAACRHAVPQNCRGDAVVAGRHRRRG